MDSNSFAAVYTLSTTAGIRPFATLAFASLALHLGWIHLAHAYAGLGTDGGTSVFFGLAALEWLGDKFPGLDHLLHVVHFATKPLAAALLVGAALPAAAPAPLADTAVLLGAANALGIHAGMTAIRGGSSAATLGLANPLVSLCEDAVTLVALGLALLLPLAGAVLGIVVTVAVVRLALAGARSLAGAARA